MKTETLLSEADRLGRAVTALEAQLRALVGDLVALQEQLERGELAGLGDAKRRAGEIREWLRIAVEMELRLERKNKARGASGGGGIGALDLERARSEIGCRLDRLRRARCPKGFPRKPE